jgi:putative nucleotidyltransferase with HDIG domain
MLQQIFNQVDTVTFRLCIQALSFLMTLVVTHMVWREFIRHRTSFHGYFTVGWVLLLVQSAFMLIIFSNSHLTGSSLPESVMPMVDHILKIGSFIFLVHAFTVVSPIAPRTARRILMANLCLLALSVPLLWNLWCRYLEHAPVGRFGYFWGDLLYEGWAVLLLTYGLILISQSTLKAKTVFSWAFSILLAKQLLHLANIAVDHNTVASILTVERLLQIPFFHITIMAIHREIVDEVAQLNHENEHLDRQLYDSVIQALVGSLEIKDPYTEGHAKRVTDYAVQIGRQLQLDDESLRNLYLGAILHDIGKIGTQLHVLNKTGELNADEEHVIKRHTADGMALISTIDSLKHIVPTILYHHERWDGTGYPHRLAGSQIPLDARIVAVADAFDAMTTNRSYRQALGMDDVLTELRAGKGRQFDPQVVDAFIHILKRSEAKSPLTHRAKAAHC